MPITIIHIFKLCPDPEFYPHSNTVSANKNPVINKAFLTNNTDIPSEATITCETKIQVKNNPKSITIKDTISKFLYKLRAINF